MVQIHAEYDAETTKMSSEKYINSTYSLSESILRQYGQLKKFQFLVTEAILNGGRGCRTQF